MDGAWFTSNLGRLLPSYQDIEVEDVEEPLPYLGNGGFYAWHDIKPAIETPEDMDKTKPEIPFAPDHVLDLDPEIPPPSSRIKSRKLGGEINLPEAIREEVLATDKMDVKLEQPDAEMGMQ